nr:F-box protein At5g49610-like [Ipomoea batatas]
MDRLEDAKLMKFSDPSFELLFSNLGESLFVEILARLPSRAAIRLKLLTKQWIALPPPPLQFQSSERVRYVMATGFLCVPAPCSLCTTNQQSQCVDHSRYDCVVVHICVYPPISHCKYRLQLFSSQEWKSLVVSSPRPIFARFLVPSTSFLVTYKGMLHMLLANYILVYDPYNCPEKFCRVIDMPTDMEDEKCFTRTLGLSQNRLCVTCRKGAHPEGAYYIWELEDYGMGKWSLVHKFYIRPNIMILSNLDLVHPNLDPKIKDTGFAIKDGTYFYWINSSGWSAFRGIVHSITQQWWPTPVPPLIRGYTIENLEWSQDSGVPRRSLSSGLRCRNRSWPEAVTQIADSEVGIDDEDRVGRLQRRCRVGDLEADVCSHGLRLSLGQIRIG